jgi:hypothetical protein
MATRGRHSGERHNHRGGEADHGTAPAELQDDPELRDNALAEKAIEIVDRLRPHLNTLLLAAVGGLLALGAWVLVSSQANATRSQSWDAYLSGLASGDVQSFDEVIRRYPGTPAAEWSRLVLADIALTEGTELLFADKDRAPPRLQAAVDLYAAILAGRPNGMLAERATFGLAKARESLGQLEEARRGYAAVAAEFPTGALAELAATHATELGSDATRQWYDWFAAQKIVPPTPPKPAAADAEKPAAAATEAPQPPAPNQDKQE